CENSSAQPVDVFEEPSSMHHNIPDEMIASSQAGTIISSPKRMRLHPQIMGRTCLGVASKECTSASTSPASTKVMRSSCSLNGVSLSCNIVLTGIEKSDLRL
ncbi:hypothetical protein GOODEAATRI_013954, partial [Goodea atripinnis]